MNRTCQFFGRWVGTVLIATLGGVLGARSALADEPVSELGSLVTYRVMHSFEGPDGQNPRSDLIVGSDGKIHGVTSYGGRRDIGGTSFRMALSGQMSVLHRFEQRNGLQPSGLMLGVDGMYYGVASRGGSLRGGTVYRMAPYGHVTVLHSFDTTLPEGRSPTAPLLQASDGQLYGTTRLGGGGNGDGSIFRISTNGDFQVLHQFGKGKDNGSGTSAQLMQADDGQLYGVTHLGGKYFSGTIYRLTLAGTFEVLHSFVRSGDDGSNPTSQLIQNPDGYLYGTCVWGGVHGSGTLFRFSPATGELTVLHHFPRHTNPSGNLVLARDGSFYGVTTGGGKFQGGTIFRLTPNGDFTQLHSFSAPGTSGGYYPSGGLVETSDGEFYGTTSAGGDHDKGTVYRLRVK